MKRSVVLFVLLAGSLSGFPASRSSQSSTPPCFEDWWRERLASAREDRHEVTALLPLRQVAEKAMSAADPGEIDRTLEDLRGAAGLHPFVASEIDRILLARAEVRGDVQSAADLRKRMGIVDRFLLAGPFRAGESPADPLEGLAAGQRWRMAGTTPQGFVPLFRLMTPHEKTLARAVFYLHAARGAEAAIRFGADDRATLWLDGRKVETPPGKHAAVPDQNEVPARLDAGWHRVLLEVEQDDGSWGFVVRVTAPDGSQVSPDITVEWPEDRAAVEQEILAAGSRWRLSKTRETSLLEALERVKGPLGKALRALELSRLQLPDRKSPEPAALVRQALTEEPRHEDILWIVGNVDSDPASRRQAFERLAGLAPQNPLVLRELIDYHAEFDQWDAVNERTSQALAACSRPDPFLTAYQALAQNSPGFSMGALSVLQRVARDYPHQSLVLKTLASLAEKNGLNRTARQALTDHLALAGGITEQRSELLSLTTAAGDEDRILALIDGALEIDPLAIDWRLRRIRFFLAQHRADEALAEIERSLALSPELPELLTLQGEARLAQGDGAGAVRSWEQARQNSDQGVQLSDRIAAVTGVDDTFGTEWTVPLEQALAVERDHPVSGDPAVVVLSRTTAFRIGADGLSSKFDQQILRVRHPEQAGSARSLDFTYSPRLQRATVIEARLLRRDGTILVADRLDRALVPDLELRMWYDTRAITLAFPRLEEGDLIELRTRITDRGPVNPIGPGYFGDIIELGGEAPVLSSRLILEFPPSLPVHHSLLHLPAAVDETREERGDRRVVVLNLPALPAFPAADNAPPAVEWVPVAVVGTAPDWTSLGRTYSTLMEPQLALDQDLREMVAKLKKKSSSNRDLVRGVYRWVIENTRYVALEFGIHTLQPYPVSAVFHRRHGDCKDKAALMVAMLKEAGIPANLVLLRTHDLGDLQDSIPTFAHFNHAIVFVPGENLWLDGTVLHHGSLELPLVDRDSLALLITPDKGGVLTRSPALTPEDAVLEREETITLLENGNATAMVLVRAKGETAAIERSLFGSADRPMLVLANRLGQDFPGSHLDEARFPAIDLEDGELRYSFSGRFERFAQVSGPVTTLPMALTLPRLPLPPPPAQRSMALTLPYPYRESTETLIRPLSRSTWRELPREGLVESEWGRASVTVNRERTDVRIRTEIVFRGGTVIPVDLPRLAGFLDQIRQLFLQRAVSEVEP